MKIIFCSDVLGELFLEEYGEVDGLVVVDALDGEPIDSDVFAALSVVEPVDIDDEHRELNMKRIMVMAACSAIRANPEKLAGVVGLGFRPESIVDESRVVFNLDPKSVADYAAGKRKDIVTIIFRSGGGE